MSDLMNMNMNTINNTRYMHVLCKTPRARNQGVNNNVAITILMIRTTKECMIMRFKVNFRRSRNTDIRGSKCCQARRETLRCGHYVLLSLLLHHTDICK